MTREVIIPYKPRDVFKPYHARQQRFAIIVAHRRAGKTVAEVNECARRLFSVSRTFPPPQAAFISPTFRQCKRNAWPYARHYFSVIPGVQFREGELCVVFPGGAKLYFVGSDNPDSLRGMYLDHAALDEYGDQWPRVWGEIVRPQLSDYGGTATFIGTPRGHNHFYDLLQRHRDDPDWYISILRASETGILPPDELELARKTMSAEQYEQEYECSFEAATPGLIYARYIADAEREGRITRVPHDPSVPVYAAWDLGYGNTAIWIYQLAGQEIHMIDYAEFLASSFTDALEWCKRRPYLIDEHILPHDAMAHEHLTGTTRYQVMVQHGFRCRVLRGNHAKIGVWEGIEQVRIAFPRMWFDARNCEAGLNALRQYRQEYDERRRVYSLMPLHDWSSHAADALRYAVIGLELLRSPATPPRLRTVNAAVV